MKLGMEPTTWTCVTFAVLPPGQHHCPLSCRTGGSQEDWRWEGSPFQGLGAFFFFPLCFMKGVGRRAVVVVGFLLQGLFSFLRPVAERFWHAACSAFWHGIRNAGERIWSSLCCKRADCWCVRARRLLHVSAYSSTAGVSLCLTRSAPVCFGAMGWVKTMHWQALALLSLTLRDAGK